MVVQVLLDEKISSNKNLCIAVYTILVLLIFESHGRVFVEDHLRSEINVDKYRIKQLELTVDENYKMQNQLQERLNLLRSQIKKSCFKRTQNEIRPKVH